jgi:hypothetical protein
MDSIVPPARRKKQKTGHVQSYSFAPVDESPGPSLLEPHTVVTQSTSSVVVNHTFIQVPPSPQKAKPTKRSTPVNLEEVIQENLYPDLPELDPILDDNGQEADDVVPVDPRTPWPVCCCPRTSSTILFKCSNLVRQPFCAVYSPHRHLCRRVPSP